MENNILVPIDYSDISKEVIRVANKWAKRTGAKLHFLHVSEESNYLQFEVGTSRKKAKFDFLSERIANFVKDQNLEVEYEVTSIPGTPYIEIINQEEKIKPDLIIMADHSHTTLETLLGSNTDYVLHNAKTPVYVYKKTRDAFDNNIVCPLDFNEINKPVIERAVHWAERTSGILHFIHVIPEQEKKLKEKIEEKLKAYLAPFNIKTDHKLIVDFGKPAVQILKLQKEKKARLIIMADHAHTIFERWMTGSNTDYLLHQTECSMYVYKE